MKRNALLGVLTLVLAALCLPGAAPGAARWMETAAFSEPGVDTFVFEDGTKVYAAPDVQSAIVGELNANPGTLNVRVVQVRILWEENGPIQKAWGRISRPFKGWVDWNNLGISQSGFIGELIAVPEDFKAVTPSASAKEKNK